MNGTWIVIISLWSAFCLCDAFVLTSAPRSLKPSSTTVSTFRIASASRNVLNIRAGLPRGVGQLSVTTDETTSKLHSTSTELIAIDATNNRETEYVHTTQVFKSSATASLLTTMPASTMIETATDSLAPSSMTQISSTSSLAPRLQQQGFTQSSAFSISSTTIPVSISAIANNSKVSITSNPTSVITLKPKYEEFTKSSHSTLFSTTESIPTMLSTLETFTSSITSETTTSISSRPSRLVTVLMPDVKKAPNELILNPEAVSAASPVETIRPSSSPPLAQATVLTAASLKSLPVTTPRSTTPRNFPTEFAGNLTLSTTTLIFSSDATSFMPKTSLSVKYFSSTLAEDRSASFPAASADSTKLSTTSLDNNSSSETTTPLFRTTISTASTSTEFSNSTFSTPTSATKTVTATVTLCDHSVGNLSCSIPDYDKDDILSLCSWVALDRKPSVIYEFSFRDMAENFPKRQELNVTSFSFSPKPGRRYEIAVHWKLPDSNTPVNIDECRISYTLMAVPFEKPKVKTDADSLGVNVSTSAISFKNPFYQSQSMLISRLSIDLSLPRSANSSVICDPSSWVNVQFGDRLSCDIKNLYNESMDELSIVLIASGDPSGKEALSYASIKRVLAPQATLTTEEPDDSPSSSPSSQAVVDTAAAAGGGTAAGVVCGTILVAVIIVLVRRHRANTPKQTWQANVSMPPGLALADDPFSSAQNYSSFAPGAIPSEKFDAYVESLERNSGLGYASLWEDVRLVGLQQSTNAAELPVNRLKNRFTNILPYDSSRVKLMSWPSGYLKKEKLALEDEIGGDIDAGNDYINANFVPGRFSVHEYIATQGPLANTIPDLWRCIWQHRCCAVVMLTKLKEAGQRKCECYWPPNVDSEAGEFPFGPLNVQLVSQADEMASPEPGSDRDRFGIEHPRESAGVWTIREFRITLQTDDRSQPLQVRTVRQYQFMDWPDQGVPSGRNRSHLLRFIRLVRSQVDRGTGKVVEPILVHCSAGVGRSGAFIAMDILLQDLAAGRPLDVNGVVRNLREYRQLVQTEQQFRFIHELLLDAINGTLIEGNAIDAPAYTKTSTFGTPTIGRNASNEPVIAIARKKNKGKSNAAFAEDGDEAEEHGDSRV